MPRIWRRQKYSISTRKALGFSTTLAALGSVTLPCWQCIAGSLAISEAPVSLQEPEYGFPKPPVHHITAHYNVPLRIPRSAIKSDLTGAHGLAFPTTLRLLKNIGIELIGNSNKTSSPSLSAYRRGSAVAGPSEAHAEVPLPRGSKVALKGSPKRSAVGPCDADLQQVSSTLSVNDLIPLHTPESMSIMKDGGRAVVQMALAKLKDDLQNAMSSSSTSSQFLTDHELATLVACCHVRCLVPEILCNVKRTVNRKSLVRDINMVRQVLNKFAQAQYFSDSEWELPYDMEKMDNQPLVTTAPIKVVDVRKCLRLAAQYVRESQDNLNALHAAFNQRRGISDRAASQLTIINAVKSALPRYRETLASISAQSNPFQLCALLQTVPHRETLSVPPGQLSSSSSEFFYTVYGGYTFCSADTIYDIVECAAALKRGEKILQLLRHKIKDSQGANSAEEHLLQISKKTSDSIADLLQNIQGSSDKELFKQGVQRNSYTHQRLGAVCPDSPTFKHLSGPQLLLRFRTIYKIVDLRLQKLVDDALSCHLLAQRIDGTDRMVRRAHRRIQRYGRELVLAYDLLQQKLHELVLNNRRPPYPEPLDLTKPTAHTSQRIQSISARPSFTMDAQKRIDLRSQHQVASSSGIHPLPVSEKSSNNVLKGMHSSPRFFRLTDSTVVGAKRPALGCREGLESAQEQAVDPKGSYVSPTHCSQMSKEQD